MQTLVLVVLIENSLQDHLFNKEKKKERHPLHDKEGINLRLLEYLESKLHDPQNITAECRCKENICCVFHLALFLYAPFTISYCSHESMKLAPGGKSCVQVISSLTNWARARISCSETSYCVCMHTGVGSTGSAMDEDGVLDIDTIISMETTQQAMEDLVSMVLVRSIGIR